MSAKPNSPHQGREFLYVVIDACVLANYAVVNLLLNLAEVGLIFPRWSSQILEETYRTHTKLNWAPRIARGFQTALLSQFPTSLVSGYEKWIPRCTNHEKDRHVLACAIEAKVGIILTYNLRDFAPEVLAPWQIRAIHPQDYLLELYSRHRSRITAAFKQIAHENSQKLGRTVTIQDELKALAPFVPKFSNMLLAEV